MSATMRATVTVATLAFLSGLTASANADTLYSTLPNLNGVTDLASAMPDPSICNSNTDACGSVFTYVPFTAANEPITGFSYYDYFYFTGVAPGSDASSHFLGTNWSIYASTPNAGSTNGLAPGTELASGFAPRGETTLQAGDSEPQIVTVRELSLNGVKLTPGTTYYLGYQTSLSNNREYSGYATSYTNYPILYTSDTWPMTTWFGYFPTTDRNSSPAVLTASYQAAFLISGGVPEPSTWAMTLLAFAGLAWAARRGRRPARQA